MKNPIKVFLAPIELRTYDPEARMADILSAIDEARGQGADIAVLPSLPYLGKADSDRIIAASQGVTVVFCEDFYCIVAKNGAPFFAEDKGTKEDADFGRVAVVNTTQIDTDIPSLAENADLVIISDTAPFERGGVVDRVRDLSSIASKHKVPIVYVNALGVLDEGKIVRAYDGAAMVFGADGARVDASAPFAGKRALVTVNADGTVDGATREEPDDGIPEVVAALRNGLSRFLSALRIRRVAIGVSGGIDSAVATALYGSILPPEDILLVGMPGPFTSATTRGLGRSLAANLGARFVEVPIGPSVELTRSEFSGLAGTGPGDNSPGSLALSPFAMENVQARDRGSRVLAAAAAAFGGVASCNANKTEITIGYGTLYGDITGWLACLGDLWKGDVYAVGRELNRSYCNRELIPEGIFKVKPSAELSEKQAVEKGLGDPLVYPYHDKLFRSWVENFEDFNSSLEAYRGGTLAKQIGYEEDLGKLFANEEEFTADLTRWWKLYRGLAVAKRMQAPPLFAVTRFPFGAITESQLAPLFPR